jgi:hypothetical protein
MNPVCYFNELVHSLLGGNGNCSVGEFGESAFGVRWRDSKAFCHSGNSSLIVKHAECRKDTCSAVGKSFGFFLDAPTSKSTSIFPSRERVRKPALLTTRMAQRRRPKTNCLALPNGHDTITPPPLSPEAG